MVTPQSLFDSAEPVAQVKRSALGLLIFGDQGTGKTTLAASCPKPLLLIRPEDIEEGHTSITHVEGVHVTPAVTDPDQIIECCDRQRATNRYKSIVLDGLSRMQDLLVKKHMGLQDTPVQQSWGMVPEMDWNWIGIALKSFVRELLRLTQMGTVVIMTCGERMFGVKEGARERDTLSIAAPKLMCNLTPSATGFVHDSFNYIVHSFRRRATDSNGNLTPRMEYGLDLEGREDLGTKFRVPMVAGKYREIQSELLNPTYEKLCAIIDWQGKSKPDTGAKSGVPVS